MNPLRFDPILGRAAQAHSDWMAANNKLDHTGVNGSSPFDRMKNAGYRYRQAGENVVSGYSTAAGAVEAWMNSQGHKDNLLTPAYEETGVGVAFNAASDDGFYWTQKFGTPI